MLGDEQGSTNVMMPVTVQTDGTLAKATLADAAASTRTAYTPYGQLRGADNLAVDRGWLGQVEDRVDGATGTGLTYLNARYYDPATSRFISPDPLMNPGDPKTLDPYRYADNNPVVFTDASGLKPIEQYDCAKSYSCQSTSASAIVAATYNNAMKDTHGRGSGGGKRSGNSSGGGNSLPAAVRVVYDKLVGIGKAPESDSLRDQALLDRKGLEATLVTGANCYSGARALQKSAAVTCAGVAMINSNRLFGADNLRVGVEQALFWKAEGPNDAKVLLTSEVPYVDTNEERWVRGPEGSLYRQDVFGNWQFGAIYASAGISLETTIAVSNAGGIAGRQDPADDVGIELGYKFYGEHPNGATEADAVDFFADPAVLKTLQDAGVYVH
jgi:RHS repeat-associated protein